MFTVVVVGDKFMPEMHLKEASFTYSACGSFTKNKERFEKFVQTGNTNFIYKNELDKACFQVEVESLMNQIINWEINS